MLKKTYSVTLDNDAVNTFKKNNHTKLSTFLNSMLMKFNSGQAAAVCIVNETTLNNAKELEKKIDKLLAVLDAGQELKQQNTI